MPYPLLLAASLVAFCFYSFLLLNFCTKILHKGKQNTFLLIFVSVVNTCGLGQYLLLDYPIYLYYLLLFIALTIEFKLLSQARLRQVLFATNAVTLHVVTSHILVYFGIALYNHTTVNSVFVDIYSRTLSIFLLAVVLTILLLSLKKIIPIKETHRVSTSKTYSPLVSVFAFLGTSSFLLASYFLIYETVTINLFLFNLFSITVLIVLFYYTFLYVIHFLNLSIFKRESDKVESQYKNILHKKEIIVNKVVRDSLTGLYNKKFIEGTLEAFCTDIDENFALMFIDINSLKSVNDSFGHHIGDKLIQCVAKAISSSIRDTDFAARISGDEFIIIASNLEKRESYYLEERIKTNIKKQNEENEFLVSAGLGLVYVDQDLKKNGSAYLLQLADEYMRNDKKAYYMKESGGK